MTQLAITLSIPPTAFHSITEKHLTHHTLGTQREKESSSAVEVVHYMSAYGCGLAPHASANCAGHIDKGLLTFIYADTEQGLQVLGLAFSP